MWWNDRIYLLDFGMVGEVGPGMREQLMMLLMAFWQQDVDLLTSVAFSALNVWLKLRANEYALPLGETLTHGSVERS